MKGEAAIGITGQLRWPQGAVESFFSQKVVFSPFQAETASSLSKG